MGLALLWALLLGVPGAPDPWSDDVGLPGYDLSFIPWNDEEPQFRERAVKVYHLSPDLGRLDGGLLVNVTGKGFIAQAATDPKCQFGAPENCVDESCIENHVVPATVVSPTLLQCISPVNEDRSFSGQEVSPPVRSSWGTLSKTRTNVSEELPNRTVRSNGRVRVAATATAQADRCCTH